MSPEMEKRRDDLIDSYKENAERVSPCWIHYARGLEEVMPVVEMLLETLEVSLRPMDLTKEQENYGNRAITILALKKAKEMLGVGE